MKNILSLIALVVATPALAEDARQLGSHEHGVSTLNLAMDGTSVLMEFRSPGADIVGFEYAAESDADLAAINAALETLSTPLDLIVPPANAACRVAEVHAALANDGDHDDHDDGHSDHSEDEHDMHAHDDHDDHDDHAEHDEEAGHTEFHAEYMLNCSNPAALTEITFTFFEAFPNANEIEVQVITASGARAFEVERDAPTLDLER